MVFFGETGKNKFRGKLLSIQNAFLHPELGVTSITLRVESVRMSSPPTPKTTQKKNNEKANKLPFLYVMKNKIDKRCKKG